jgi:glyoxylase-like metal-dependent hydrolase (beta-lactamase superfamily II)
VNLRILELTPALTQIKLPLPFELREVNVHLLRTAHDGYVLFDTGYYAPDCFDTLEASLRHLRVTWTDITTVALTHMHPDHVGNANRILQLTEGRARIAMRADEAELLNAISDAGRPPWFVEMLARAATPEDLRAAVHEAFSNLRERSQSLVPDLVYGDEFQGFEVIHTPGHSPGHVCFFDRVRGMLLSGDHMLPGITPNIGWLPQQDTLAQYLHSLDKVAPLPVADVVPAHGRPFGEHRAWLEATAAHHEERCEQIRVIAKARPVTAHEIVGEVWKRKLAPFHYQFAVSEILAHLEYMHARGRIECHDTPEGARWIAGLS